MAIEPLIRNIALDTSFIEGQNFLAGHILYNLADLGKKEFAKIYLTDIVYREVLSRFNKRVTEEDNKIKGVRKTIESNVRVLKNFEDYKAYFTLPELDLPAVLSEFKEKFDKWIREANITIIATGHLTIEKIFEDYFANNAPFGSGEKKAEFPDAFSFLALQDYFMPKKLKCYFVTQDKDFDEMPKATIIPIEQVSEKIDEILREEEKKSNILKLIDKGFEDNKGKLEKEAHGMVTSYLEDAVESKGEIEGMEIDVLQKVDLSDIDITDYRIVFISENNARLECEGNFAYELTIAVEDNTNASYDREDDTYYGTEYYDLVVKDSKDVNFTVLIDFEVDEDYVEMSVEDINDGKGFDVFKNRDDYRYN